jgi:hypothetical protein
MADTVRPGGIVPQRPVKPSNDLSPVSGSLPDYGESLAPSALDAVADHNHSESTNSEWTGLYDSAAGTPGSESYSNSWNCGIRILPANTAPIRSIGCPRPFAASTPTPCRLLRAVGEADPLTHNAAATAAAAKINRRPGPQRGPDPPRRVKRTKRRNAPVASGPDFAPDSRARARPKHKSSDHLPTRANPLSAATSIRIGKEAHLPPIRGRFVRAQRSKEAAN